MKKECTSREELLSVTLELAETEGVSAVNMRDVATKCGVALGTVYNYFDSKETLMLAAMEKFWYNTFHNTSLTWLSQTDFLSAFNEFWNFSNNALHKFKTSFISQMDSLRQQTRVEGKALEKIYFSHIESGLLQILKADKKISPNKWTEDFTPEQFISLLIEATLYQLRREERSPVFLLELIKRTIY